LDKTVFFGAIIVGTILLASASFDSAYATIDMFIKMDPIKGESTVSGHEDEIDVLSYSFEVTKQISSVGSTPPSFGRTEFAFSFTHFLDSTTPQLYTHTAEGRSIQEAILELCQPSSGKKLLCYMEYKFLNPVLFPSVMTEGSITDVRPIEKVTLLFCEVEWKYTPFDNKGEPKSPIQGRFDLCPPPEPGILNALIDGELVFSFAGAQVVWIEIDDPDIDDTDQGKGEPDVKVNGNILRMAQGVDGKWYGFIADIDNALIADSGVAEPGTGSDFGVFCSKDSGGVLGDSFDTSKTQGFAIQDPALVTNAIDGNPDATPLTNLCTNPIPNATPNDFMAVLNGEVDINPFPSAESAGQIGIRQGFWPFIQLYDFVPTGDVVIQYNRGGGVISITLLYDDIS